MKPSKAIEYLDFVLKAHPRLEHDDFGQAVKLGREALEFYQALRQTGFPPKSFLLPGEDPE